MIQRSISLLLTLAMSMAVSLFALSPSYYSENSVLSTGHWVKISTTAPGIYELSYDRLRELGFDNPERVQVFGYASTATTALNYAFAANVPDDLIPLATRHGGDDRLLFYGGGDVEVVANRTPASYDVSMVRRNLFDTASYYFLTEVESPADAVTAPMAAANESYDISWSHIHTDLIEEDVQNPVNGGTAFHGPKLSDRDEPEFSFHVRNYRSCPNAPYGSFAYHMAVSGSSTSELRSVACGGPIGLPGNTTVENNTASKPTNYEGFRDITGYTPFSPISAGALDDADVRFRVYFNRRPNSIYYYACNRTLLRYPRANRLDEVDPAVVLNFVSGDNMSGQRVAFSAPDASKAELWITDDPYRITRIEPTSVDAEDGTAMFVLPSLCNRGVAFDTSASYPEPTVVGDVDNQNLHALPVPDMLIIATAEMMPQAERLAELHRRYQGMDVAVARHDQVYNEFNSGARDVMAYRRLAKMFYDRDTSHSKFKYLLLIGPGSYDNRGVIVGAGDRLVCFEQDRMDYQRSFVLNFTNDGIFGMLDDGYRHSAIHLTELQVAVGRIPALNPQKLEQYVDKVEARFENPLTAAAYASPILTSGNGDYALHTAHSLEVGDAMVKTNPSINPVFVNEEVYPKGDNTLQSSLIAAALRRGSGYFTYSGHGNANFIQMWNPTMVSTTEYKYQPFVMFSSCDQFAFDHMAAGLIENMLFQPNGGAIAGVGASRSVYITWNQLVCRNLAKAYASAAPGETFGRMFIRARSIGLKENANTTDNPTSGHNMLSYNLAGDPALPIGVPDQFADIVTVDGVDPESATLTPLRPAVFKGEVYANDLVDETFDGTAEITIFDGVHPEVTYNYDNLVDSTYQKYKQTVEIGSDILARANVEVKAGRFEATMAVPVPTYSADSHRIMITAVSDDRRRTAFTADRALNIADALHDGPETAVAPVITDFYIGDETFTAGDEAGASVDVHASIQPSPSGICFANSGVKSRTHLVLDGMSNISDLDHNLKRNGSGGFDLDLSIPNLTDGVHTLELVVADNAGNADARTIEFVTVSRNLSPELRVSDRTARTKAEFCCDESFDHSRLIITDASGRTVHSAANPTFPYEWNLADSEGTPCPDGLYKASLQVRSGQHHGHSAPATVVIVR